MSPLRSWFSWSPFLMHSIQNISLHVIQNDVLAEWWILQCISSNSDSM